jgi:dolichol-phosphate mannosyltransferase
VLVPTRNEAANVEPLVGRVTDALSSAAVEFEVVFVDDSEDATPRAILAQQQVNPRVRLLHRAHNERVHGLGGAVAAGIVQARGDVIVVMDGDLQHPPGLLPKLVGPIVDGSADLAVATRYSEGGSREGLDGATRRFVSSACRGIVHLLVPRTRGVSDPLGGYFALHRRVIEHAELQPEGFKILLEILVRGSWHRVAEVPFDFAARVHGESKAGVFEGVRFARHLVKLAGAGVQHSRGREPPHRRIMRGTRSVPARVVAAVAAIGVAYFYSLRTLVGAWSPTGATTVCCIVPLLALALLTCVVVPAEPEPSIHDRDVDYLLGLGLLSLALFVLWSFRRHLGVAFWVYRVDLLSLPIFAAGVIAILFGTRAMWRLRTPLLFLLLAWPPLMRSVATAVNGLLTQGTVRATSLLTAPIPHTQVRSDGFSIGSNVVRVIPGLHGTAAIVLSGVGATAFVLAFRGRSASWRLLFIATTCCAAFLANVVAISFSAYTTDTWGASRGKALTGNIVFLTIVAGVIALVALIFRRRPSAPRSPSARGVAVPRRGAVAPFAVVSAAALLALGATGSLSQFASMATALGTARASAVTSESMPVGYRVVGEGAKRHELPAIRARRYTVAPINSLAMSKPTGVQVDVLGMSTPGTAVVHVLDRYYPLRAYKLRDNEEINLGFGILGEALNFHSKRGLDWSTISWVWPVRHDNAQFERVVVSWGDPVTMTEVDGVGTVASAPLSDLQPLEKFAEALVAADLSSSPASVELGTRNDG